MIYRTEIVYFLFLFLNIVHVNLNNIFEEKLIIRIKFRQVGVWYGWGRVTVSPTLASLFSQFIHLFVFLHFPYSTVFSTTEEIPKIN